MDVESTPRTNPHPIQDIARVRDIPKPELPANASNILIEDVNTPKNHRQAMQDELAHHTGRPPKTTKITTKLQNLRQQHSLARFARSPMIVT